MTRDSIRRLGRLTVLPGLLAVVLLAACGDLEAPTVGGDVPTVDPSSVRPTRSLPAVGGTWTGFGTKCPTLSSAAARALGATGEGTPTADYLSSGPFLRADCRWGPEGGPGTAVRAQAQVYPNQAGADGAWQTLSAGGQDRVADVGDEGFRTEELDGFRVEARSNNAVVTVWVTVSREGVDAAGLRERVRKLEPVVVEIARDVIGDLR
ncbi:hypothetical protein V1634_25840 [Plantactinospora veratri]|uniref:DUF3558 domain-containing protein n=1 Tax=Plantactinospora veratri TaxID=1436122 RepID=A0ABU7SJW8_9ACTN